MGIPVVTAILLGITLLGIATPRFPHFPRWEGRFPFGRRSAPVRAWRSRAVNDLSAAEDLLDWLEAGGTAERELVILGNSSFEVHWR
ncbi:MAG TPA: hypothetical protein VGF55_02720 [Gemmataceae bacterium]